MSNWTADEPRADRPAGGSNRIGRRVILLALSLMVLLPAGMILFVIPALSGGPYDSPDAIDSAQVKSLRVHVLNRAGLDGGEDIGPYEARPSDVPALLAPLRGLNPLPEAPPVRGPWLGEYRVGTVGGRRTTVRLYWTQWPDVGQSDLPAGVSGPAVLHGRPELVPGAFGLRVQVGGKWYEGGNPLAVTAVAEAAAAGGTKTR